jgi:hypothetical protein
MFNGHVTGPEGLQVGYTLPSAPGANPPGGPQPTGTSGPGPQPPVYTDKGPPDPKTEAIEGPAPGGGGPPIPAVAGTSGGDSQAPGGPGETVIAPPTLQSPPARTTPDKISPFATVNLATPAGGGSVVSGRPTTAASQGSGLGAKPASIS